MKARNDQLDLLLERFQQRRPLRAGSLIISVFGDAIVPRGGVIWIGSLIQLLEPMGINQRLVRTSIFRLTQEGWLTAKKVGRRSYYGLTDTGRRQFEKAFRRVYAGGQPAWDGAWTLVLLNQLPPELRDDARQELKHMGMGLFSPTVLAYPSLETADLIATLQELNALDDTIIFQTREQHSFAPRPLRRQVQEAWDLDQLSVTYQAFVDRFRLLWNQMRKADHLQAGRCFLTRIMLIHEYRKILLRDPLLPEQLQPADWEGQAARQLCRNLYRLVYKDAEDWLSWHAETAEGPLPAPAESFYRRFGGLD